MAETRKTASATGDEKREAELANEAADRGWEIQTDGTGLYRIVDAKTGTWVAAVWTRPDGFGYTLNGLEDVLRKQSTVRTLTGN